MIPLEKIVDLASSNNASDIHIVAGLPVKIRVDGKIRSLNEEILSVEDCKNYAIELAGEDYKKIESIGELDMGASIGPDIRTRVSIFRQRGKISIAIRILQSEIPTVEQLRLPEVVNEFAKFRNGLVLITGETGSGKTSTIAAVVDMINKSREGHIVTIEDPIEYIFIPEKCVINQREIGIDTRSFDDALRSILREDPNVIVVGEMRDLTTIEAALTAAETGHLVFSTLHTNSAADTIDRIISVFPEGKQRQIRIQLASTLKAVVSQTLIPKANGKGRIAACEVMMINPAIRNLIREGKTTQIDSFIGLGAQEGSISMDSTLVNLMRQGEITREDALMYARDREHFPKM